MEEDDPKVNADFTVNDGKLYYKRKNGQEVRRWVFDIRKIKNE